MSRSVPWRNKPTPLITEMIPVAAQMKLYLINQIGPTSFLFKDENDNKFKVVIGSKISCSCAVVNNDHCIHTLFVMLKKYKVPQTHPILWQASYLDSELEGLIQFKYMEKKKQSTTKKYISKKKAHMHKQTDQDDFPPLQEDAACPICYQEMQGQCYSTCTTCRKSIHSKCLRVWAMHKQNSGNAVTCPMCRSQFVNALGMVFHDLQRWQKRFSTHKGTVCKTCGVKNIKGLLYKCLMCPNTDLCKMCFEGNQHLEHYRFFVKELTSQPWRIAPIRIKKSRKQLFELIREVDMKQLPNDIQSEEFVISLFPTVKQSSITKSVDELNIIGNDMLTKQLCYKCHNIGDEYMRKLNCGHPVHESCLRSMISNKDYICDVDNEPICPGYLNAMGIKVQRKKGRSADIGFIRAQEESQRIKQKLGIGIGPNISIQTSQKFKTEKPKQRTQNFSVGGKVQRFNQKKDRVRQNSHNRFNARAKDKNFRIMKKNVLERKQQLQSMGVGIGFSSPMMVTGLKSSGNQPLLPKPPSNQMSRNFGF